VAGGYWIKTINDSIAVSASAIYYEYIFSSPLYPPHTYTMKRLSLTGGAGGSFLPDRTRHPEACLGLRGNRQLSSPSGARPSEPADGRAPLSVAVAAVVPGPSSSSPSPSSSSSSSWPRAAMLLTRSSAESCCTCWSVRDFCGGGRNKRNKEGHESWVHVWVTLKG